MKNVIFTLLFSLIVFQAAAQEVKTPDVRETVTEENDTIWGEPIQLDEIVISRDKIDDEARKQFLLLQNRVYKVYPYAKIAAERLVELDKNMAKLKTERERKQYFKIVESYIENEFTDRLKKLSRKQGQILVKLVYRQTGHTTFDLVKDYKSGWKAFWAKNTAKVFDIDIKARYEPYQVNEDYLIETILDRAFTSGRLPRQEAAKPINYEQLNDYWQDRVSQANSAK